MYFIVVEFCNFPVTANKNSNLANALIYFTIKSCSSVSQYLILYLILKGLENSIGNSRFYEF